MHRTKTFVTDRNLSKTAWAPSVGIREYLYAVRQKVFNEQHEQHSKSSTYKPSSPINDERRLIHQMLSSPLPKSHHDKPSHTAQSKCPLGEKISLTRGRTSRKLSKFIQRSLSAITMPPPPTIGPNRSITSSDNVINKDHVNLVKADQAIDVDSGYAWIILAIVFVINASTFGAARAYGLIFEKLAREGIMSRSDAAMPFTLMGTIENMAGPLSGYFLARSGSWRVTVFVGSSLITLAHLAAAVLNFQIGQLISMGLMCGLGMSFITISFFQVNNAYFVRYRSTAFGLGLTGAAFGTLYISPLCQYFLDNYGTSYCYLMLGCILLPNVSLSLLLKPRKAFTPDSSIESKPTTGAPDDVVGAGRTNIRTISGSIEGGRETGMMLSIRQVLSNPMFHLIWPTQLLFCWLNFVFGMIVVDFAKDRGLNACQSQQLVPAWAIGQLAGRMLLGSLVDLKFLSYKSFTVICCSAISLTSWMIINIRIDDNYRSIFITTLVFILSMFIALLYILFNGLVTNYVETRLQPLSIGISSFAGSPFLLPRAYVIGYYRDTIGNYDAMISMFSYTSLLAALMWLTLPLLCRWSSSFLVSKTQSRKNLIENLRAYSQWRFSDTFDIQLRSEESKSRRTSLCQCSTMCGHN